MKAGRVVFRADAGLDIGTGHVMRCLTLANCLSGANAEVVFVTRAHRGHLIPAIIDRGHRVVPLPDNTIEGYGPHPAPPAHAGWLAADWRSDAEATYRVLEETGASWLVMDHYALDSYWQDAALPPGVQLLVLDDLADRPHVADILLDQNAGRLVDDYNGLVPPNCSRLIGPKHALLRPEFALLRPRALARRKALQRPERLLITLGGVDRDNATGAVLEALAEAPTAAGLRVCVVLGRNAPALAEVQAQAAVMPMPVEVAVNVANIAQRMMQSDLCVGAAGSTAWERCALGLPTLQVVLADNQAETAQSMAENGVSLSLPSPTSPDFAAALEAGLANLAEPHAYWAMARTASSLTHGDGAPELARTLLERTSTHAY
ncbi:UDP-2,4-diacetamido-2,4,6-trideoxy-beta-L-altropyranose hydrolase [Sulfitobacter sp. 1A13496]|uniref:UDP-2,4-diacetamido-2,4, 6-trideoxy-beta-L-altropyranose hydrolase n=1 Tax=Sulfitobacter sp. 1A13496 TaxID=3368596 RepID=UPI003746CEE1